MRPPRVLLTDLDRTLTGPDLVPDPRALDAVGRLRERAWRVVLVTGRPAAHVAESGLLEAFDAVIAENGAVAFAADGTLVPEDATFASRARSALGDLGPRFAWGRVAGSAPREMAAEASARLRAAGVAHAVSFNADEVMVLPPSVDKGTGSRAAVRRFGARFAAAAIGDGENDVPMLRLARCAAVPANAHPAAVAAATRCLKSAYSAGFTEFAASLAREDLRG